MSVAGIDVGNSCSCVALARNRGIDVLMNQESKRETPSVVAFSDKQRAIGTEGAARMTTNLKNTVTEVGRLIGKKFDDPDVQKELQLKCYKIVPGPNNEAMIEVEYQNQMTQFLPEQILSMLLIDQKQIAEKEQGSTVTDCVISVPAYFGERERYATLCASKIPNLNCLRLMNETTAAALAFGIYKTDLPEKEPMFVAFVDVGHTATQVSIVSFVKGSLEVKSHDWDSNLGGRDFGEVLFNHFADQFKQKYNLDVRDNAKSSLRMRAGCEKVKKILGGINEAQQMIESVMDDQDFELRTTREEFENLCEGILSRLTRPMETALALAQVDKKKINSVELFGGGSRVPAIINAVKSFFEQEPSRTLHQKEVVSRGCALQCAMLSPIFRVKEFDVKDWYTGRIFITYNKEDGSNPELELYPRGNSVPSTKEIKIQKKQADKFEMKVESQLENGTREIVGHYEIGPVVIPEGHDKIEVKIRTKLDLFGLFRLESAHISYVKEYEEAVEVKPVKESNPFEEPAKKEGAEKEEAENAGNNNENGQSGDAEMSDPAEGGEKKAETPQQNQNEEAPKVKIEKKKKTERVDIPIQAKFVMGTPQQVFDQLLEKEGQMMASDREHIETSEAKNAFEAYVYNLRNGLFDKLNDFVKEEERSKLIKELDDWENWLYEDGEDERKSVYVEKLNTLKKKGDPIVFRYEESQTREQAKTELQSRCNMFVQLADSDAPELAHIIEQERATVKKECADALNWLNEKLSHQSKIQKWDTPILLTADIYKKRDTVVRVCEPIMTKSPPPPPKKEDNKQKSEEKTTEGEKQQEGDGMDVDESPQNGMDVDK